MRAYLACLRADGMIRFIPEDFVADALLDEVLTAWARPGSVVFRAVLAEEDAELVRHELRGGRPDEAVAWIRDLAVELLPVGAANPGRTRGDEEVAPRPRIA